MEPNFDKIEAYLDEEMNLGELREFEEEMERRPELREAVAAHQAAREAIEVSIGDSLRAELEALRAEAEETDEPEQTGRIVQLRPQRRLRPILAIAAGVLLLIFAGSFWYAGNNYSSDHLAMSYYDEDELQGLRGGTAENPLTAALEDIRQKNYADAAEKLTAVLPENDYYWSARYYLGHTFFQREDYAAAIAEWQRVATGDDPRYVQRAEWQMVLAYLRNEQAEEANFKAILQGIVADPGHAYHAEAVELQGKLGSFWRNLVM